MRWFSYRARTSDRIAFIYDGLLPFKLGGGENYYRALAIRMSTQQPVAYITWRYPPLPPEWSMGSTEIVGVSRPRRDRGRGGLAGKVGVKTAFALGTFWHLLLHGGRYSVVHCAGVRHITLPAAALALVVHPNTRLVADWHEVWRRETWPAQRKGGAPGVLAFMLQSFNARLGDAAMTFSNLHATRLRRLRRRGVVELVPEFVPEHADPISTRTGAHGAPLIVYAGRLTREKRVHLLPQVVRELRCLDGRPWRAEIFGRGPQESRLRDCIKAAEVTDHVTLRGYAPWSELASTMQDAAVLLHPSNLEGFGLIVLEAAACGLPTVVVAGPDNAATELIEEGINGTVAASAGPADLARAILTVLADPSIHANTKGWYEGACQRFCAESAVAAIRGIHDRLGVTPRGAHTSPVAVAAPTSSAAAIR